MILIFKNELENCKKELYIDFTSCFAVNSQYAELQKKTQDETNNS